MYLVNTCTFRFLPPLNLATTDNAPMFTIPNVVFPVAEYFLEDILKVTRSVHVCILFVCLFDCLLMIWFYFKCITDKYHQ